MAKIDLGSDLEFEVSYNGKEYKLREPSLDDVEKYQKSQKSKEDEESFDDLKTFICTLGMPIEVINAMGITKVKTLADGLLGGLEKK